MLVPAHKKVENLPRQLRRSQLKMYAYFATKRLFKFRGHPPKAMVTSLRLGDRPVLFSHAPKAAGTSLRRLLGTSGVTRAFPEHVLSEAEWNRAFVIAAVRHPFDRFLSGYAYHVKSNYRGALFKAHGEALKSLNQFEYIEFILQYPEKLGLMSQWVCFPSKLKPEADLVLRVEESSGWVEQIEAAGIDLKGRSLERLNATGPAKGGSDKLAGLSKEDVERLRTMVFDAFRPDYDRFGYTK